MFKNPFEVVAEGDEVDSARMSSRQRLKGRIEFEWFLPTADMQDL